jgi:hypothetical protein
MTRLALPAVPLGCKCNPCVIAGLILGKIHPCAATGFVALQTHSSPASAGASRQALRSRTHVVARGRVRTKDGCDGDHSRAFRVYVRV